MHKLVLPLLIVVAMDATAYGQSLADVAKQEEERRKSVNTTSRVYTNQDLGEPLRPAPIPPSAPTAAKLEGDASKKETGKVEAGDAATEAAKTPDAQVNEHRDEKHWRERSQQYRTRLNKLRADVTALEGRLETLRAGDQTPGALSDIRLCEQDLTKFKTQLGSLEGEWAQIEQQARNTKIPAAWLQ